MKLYTVAPRDSGGKVRWLLLEMGVPFEDIKLNYKNGDTKSAAHLARHPVGQVPVLEDGALTIFESHAIVTYLADKYIDKGFAPDFKKMDQRAMYYQWMFFCTATAERFFSKFQQLGKMTEEYRAKWGTHIEEKTQMTLKAIDKQLNGKEYLLGAFSAVDTCMGYALDSISSEPFFNDYPNVKKYFSRLSERPACLKSEIFIKK